MRGSRAAAVLAAIAAGSLAGCGDDEGATANPPPKPTAAPPAPGTPGGPAKTLLAEKLHVEDRVACAIPDAPSDPKDGKCDLKAPSCGDHLYCMQLAQGAYCEPCPERDRIRHVFRERDFAAQQNRDPFEASGVKPPVGVALLPPGGACRRDQLVATSWSYLDLKLVGIVAQGTQRKVLMMAGPLGYMIKRGDCVGKEKAVVADIGTGFIKFQIEPDPAAFSARPPSVYEVQLNPQQLAANDPGELPGTVPRTTIGPVILPPPVIPPGTAPRPGAGSAGPAAGSAVAPTGSGAPATAPAVPPATPPVAPVLVTPPAPRAPAAAPPLVTPPTVSPSPIAPPIAPAPAIAPKQP